MSSNRKPTAQGPVAPVTPASGGPRAVLPADDDDVNPAESTVVEDGMAKAVNQKWEEATVSERNGSGKRRSTPVPPKKPMEDSAQVLLDAGRAPAGTPRPQTPGPAPHTDEQHPLANLPTVVSHMNAAAPGRLVVIGGNDRGREFVLAGRETSIGRGVDNHVILTDIAVSRRHIILLYDGARYSVRDLGSGNGSLVNGIRITADTFLRDGDQIEIGNTLLRIEHPSQPAIAPQGGPPGGPMMHPPGGPMVGPGGPMMGPGGPMPMGPGGPMMGPPMQMGPGGPMMGPGGPMPVGPGGPMPMGPGGPMPMGPGGPMPMGPGGPMPMGPGGPMMGPPGAPPWQQQPPPQSGPNRMPLQSPPPSGEWPHPGAPMPPQASAPFAQPYAPPGFGAGGSSQMVDLKGGQRKKFLLAIGGVLVLGGLLGIVIALATGGDKAAKPTKTEASVVPQDKKPNPALDELLEAPPTTPVAGTTTAPTDGKTASVAPIPPETKVEPKVDPTPAPPEKVEPKVEPPKPEPRTEKKKEEPKKKDPPPPPPKKEKEKEVASSSSPKSTGAAEKAAAQLYRDKKFDAAAEMIRAAASKDAASADRLMVLARDYATVGSQLAKGDASVASAPTAAMFAYQEALKADSRSGKGVHATYLRGQVAKVAPKAAMSYMAQGKFEQARAACDAAVNYGVGTDSTVQKVRQMLEGKAKELYNKGLSLEKSAPADAKALYRRVLKMVPADSPWYTKAYAALNKPGANRGEDEDE